MNEIVGAFRILAWIMVVMLVVAGVLLALYLRWKKEGQERGF